MIGESRLSTLDNFKLTHYRFLSGRARSSGITYAMARGFQVTYLYNDTDIIELRIIADNGRFCGTANVYVGMGELSNVAECLRGFPNDSSDTREVTLGAFGQKFAGGAVRLRLYCTDLAGHTTAEIAIEADYATSEVAETATVFAKFEPAALDDFLKELPELENRLSGDATLAII